MWPSPLPRAMEPLQRLTRRQLDVLETVSRLPAGARGVALNELARSLRLRSPSTLPHLRALQSLDLVERTAGKTRITSAGERCLDEYRRHHRVVERMFASLDLPLEDACRAAREIDLALSHRTVEKLCAAEGHPSRCPHGEPIPPCGGDGGAGGRPR